jgi:hypothetical protein
MPVIRVIAEELPHEVADDQSPADNEGLNEAVLS